MLGQALQTPLHALCACRDSIKLYANITRATPQLTPEAFARSARGAVADGFRAVKLAPFGGPYPIAQIDHLEEGIECVRAVRQAVGPAVDILLDCYGLFTADAALSHQALEDVGLYWFEEPAPDDDYAGYLQAKRPAPYPRGGERYEFHSGPRWNSRFFTLPCPMSAL